MATAILDVPQPISAGDDATYSPVHTRHVLHVINGEHYAGAERVQDLLALRLPDFGFEVGFACLKDGVFAARRQAQQAILFQSPMRRRLDLSAARRLAELIKEQGYCLVHAHTPRSALIGRIASLLARVPLVYHVHSPTIRDTTHAWRNRINRWVERMSLVGVRRLIAVSESLGRHVRSQGYGDDLVKVIHNGVPGPVRLLAREAPSQRWTLGIVALFRPRKGVEVLLDALALLRRNGRDVRLRAIGTFETPDYEAEIRAQATRLQLDGAIDWVGFPSDVPEELSRLDALVLPSLFGEGLPMVVLEAMAHGVPVIASAVEGVPEAIRDGVDGLLAKPGDAVDLARALSRLIDGDPRWEDLRESAHTRQQSLFSDRAMAAAVAEVYRQLLKN